MGFTPTGNEAITTGTTEVTAVPAPAASQRHIVTEITIYNADTVQRTFTIQVAKASTNRIKYKQAVAVGKTLEYFGRIVLDATDETVEVFADASATTTESDIVVAYGIDA